jgi:peptidoglycan/xylan/chitin deacetylase (PgdA/CDA1 family)
VGGRVINICFHGIGTPGRTLEPGETGYWIDHATYLDAVSAIASWPGTEVSFDDGNSSDVELGLEALLRHGLRASFFVIADRIDTPGSLSTDQLRELVRHGMGVGSHGMHHRPWPATTQRERVVELHAARERIADASGVAVDEAACPLGRYDRSVLDELRRAGYTRVFTSDRRAGRRGAWLQPRFSFRADDDAASFRAHLDARCRIHRQVVGSAVGAVKRLR